MNTERYGSRLAHVCLFLSAAFLLASVHAAPAAAAPVKIAIVGDSTVCDYKQDSPKRGWGQLLPELLPKGTQVINVARGGASTKTFPADRWQRVLSSKSDYVLIQFGHNDSHAKDKPESTDAATDYQENLRRYIREAREAGIEPILVTPVRRRLYKDGHPTTELKRYAEAMTLVAFELKVKLIDLHTSSGVLFDRLGEAGTDAYTVNKLDQADRPGLGDRTHFTEIGAREMARLVMADLAKIDIRLSAANY